MKFLIVLIIAYISIVLALAGNGIISKFLAKPGQFPFTVSLLQDDLHHVCTGSLLTLRNIISAAHCGLNAEIKIAVAGSVNIYSYTDRYNPFGSYQQANIIRNIRHPEYIKNRKNIEFDVQLLTVKPPFCSTNDVAPIALATKPMAQLDPCVALGFGYHGRPEKGFGIDGKLRFGLFFVRNKDLCSQTSLENTSYCITSKSATPEFGDSGGPLVDFNTPVRIQGICVGYNTRRTVSLYASIITHKKWILDNIINEGDVRVKSLTGYLRCSSRMYTPTVLTLIIGSFKQ